MKLVLEAHDTAVRPGADPSSTSPLPNSIRTTSARLRGSAPIGTIFCACQARNQVERVATIYIEVKRGVSSGTALVEATFRADRHGAGRSPSGASGTPNLDHRKDAVITAIAEQRPAAGRGKFYAGVHNGRSTAREAQMPDQVSAVPAARPVTKERSGEQKLIEGRVGFIGLGRMGIAMATNLARSGCKVTGFVRSPERLKELSALGMDSSVEIAELFDCSIVISMLPDDTAVREVVSGLKGCP
jgi:hypothetical protein